MKMIAELETAFTLQIKVELESWYCYLNLATWYINNSLPGCTHWMHKQAEEELFHATKMRDYLIERNNKVSYNPLGVGIQPPNMKNFVDGFHEALKYEQCNSGRINNLSDLCDKHKDRGATIFLQWYISEQEEEESSVQTIIDQFLIAGDSRSALLSIDKMLGKRKSE